MNSKLINIAGLESVEDPSYRYKMPKLELKWEGKGGGRKTVFSNCEEVARALHRNPKELCKWFGIDLGVPTSSNDIFFIKGHHTYQILYPSLCKYIETFVLCPNCRQPEVPKYKVKSGLIQMKCSGCGHRCQIDSGNKLCPFILKNTAQKKKKPDKEKKKKKREKKRDKKQEKKKKKEMVEESEESDESEKENLFDFGESIVHKSLIDGRSIIERFMNDFERLPLKEFFINLRENDLPSGLLNIDPLEVLKELEDFCLQPEIQEKAVPVFSYILQLLYEKDFLSEEVLLAWSFLKEELPKDSVERIVYNDETVKFIEWLSEDSGEDE
tara:strand:- start:89 stop:1069 length:981 start_codon:yes stop_codon:yes gene_type:complete